VEKLLRQKGNPYIASMLINRSDVLKVYSVLYRIVLVLFVVLMFAAQMAVGVAGHNKNWSVTEYLPLIYSAVTFSTLWIYAKNSNRQMLRYINIILVSVGTIAALYVVLGSIINDGFIIGLIIPGVLFIFVGSMLIYSLMIDKDGHSK
jgi:hypothetical protein